MTNNDIIRAAFKVWGRELYRTTSLTQIAQELGVSKPALYRHFKDKDALLKAMFIVFFDEFTSFIREAYDRAVSAAGQQERCLIMMRIMAEYYIRNREAFIFSLIQVNSRREKETIGDEFRARGIDMRRLVLRENQNAFYPSKFQLVIVTLIFHIAQFHQYERKSGEVLSDNLVNSFLVRIEDYVVRGLNLDARKTAGLDYRELEQRASGFTYEDSENNTLLKAVAGAVAEAGPWDASMEMVARRSGLSKSGLYSHFKNKQDMMGRFFITEFTKIVNFARAQIEKSEVPEEQLYLGIVSIVDYLRARPEILMAIDWIKTRHLELRQEVNDQLYLIIGSIKLEAIRKHDHDFLVSIANWIIFLIVNTLVWWPSGKKENTALLKAARPDGNLLINNVAEIPNDSFRILFRFIALGLEGLNT